MQSEQELEGFRAELRDWLEANCPAEMRGGEPSEASICWGGKNFEFESDAQRVWMERAASKGYTVPTWPVEYGGAGMNRAQEKIFKEEMDRIEARNPLQSFGIWMLGPALLHFGTHEQKLHYLPPIARGEIRWCQGYSEPGAGSDLASVKTTAERDGDHYVVNGQKTWTTLGQYANMIFCLVRTSKEGKPQEGISFLLIDMDDPGITVRPIVLIDGEPEVNEVFFDNVRVPVTNLVGEENKGWTYAKYLLTHERTNIAGVGFANAGLANLKRIARLEQSEGRPLIEDPLFAARIAEVEIALMAMATTNLRVVSAAAAGQAPGAESSMLKVKGTVIRQEINALTKAAVGPYAMPFVSEALEAGTNAGPVGPAYAMAATPQYLNNRKLSIYGGSNEVQKTIIAKAILEL